MRFHVPFCNLIKLQRSDYEVNTNVNGVRARVH